jgi:hypothetical protein
MSGIPFIPKINFGFVIIAPEHNIGRIQGTIRSIKNYYREAPYICVVDNTTSKEEIAEIKELCPTHKGKGTITSLLNTGMKKGNSEWNFLVMEGTSIRPALDVKFGRWISSQNDVLYPIVVDYNREGIPVKIYSDFEEATLNGLCIHQKFFKAVGDFSENPLNISKKFWALEACDLGGKFKAILGAKIC